MNGNAVHCDRVGCDNWQRLPGTADFLTINAADTALAYFCSLNCIAHYAAAHSQPPEVMGFV
jgi:hypothetical protein